MIIDRLRVRGKLNLLLLLPLTAVVLVAVPFVAGQVGNAQSSRGTADSAASARELGALVWELQRERLVTAAFLADREANEVTMVRQQQVVTNATEAMRKSLPPNASEELANALVRIGSLNELRRAARQRGVPLDSVARAYHAVIDALIDALRLVPQHTSDAEGTRQLTALDALLRANEYSSLRGMALVAVAVNPQTGREILTNALAQSQMFVERFAQQADPDQAAIVVLVDQGDAARRVQELAGVLPDPANRAAVEGYVRSVFAAAESQASLRRLAQDSVTSEITEAALNRAETAAGTAWAVGLAVAVLFALVFVLAFVVSRSIAHPLQRLTRAASTVADLTNAELVRVTDVESSDEQPPRLTAIDVQSSDEVGELAVAFNQVQSTAAMLLERQVVTRRNVSLMFANVAQRTQNLVRRQLALVDELERDEQNTRLLSRLYRLDHLSTRLRRNAENLLVVAGSRNENRIAAPAPLVTVLRSALAEIEDYRRVRLGSLPEVTIAAQLVPDIALVFAELLENATAFSPPGSTVDVHAALIGDGWCQVSVVDNGIGMTERRLLDENRRLVERERLDITPTSVLGLFVVGRLARRHGLEVELVPTKEQGITAVVRVPPDLFTRGISQAPVELPVAVSRRPKTSGQVAIPSIPVIPGSFSWFDREPTVEDVPEPVAVQKEPEPEPEQRGSLNRRVRGAQLPESAIRAPEEVPAGPVHDPNAARSTMDIFQDAFARAATTPPDAQAPPPEWPLPQRVPAPPPAPMLRPPQPTGGGGPLTRRTPGAHLAAELRAAQQSTPASRPQTDAPPRDPEAERSAFDGWTAGIAKAEEQNNID